jgi:catechol 2,3-dioxygenase-like lactoylglutathione lyase family enzyme
VSGREGEVAVFIVLVLLLSVAPIIVGARLAERRGRSVWFGIVLAFVLGWIGVGIVAIAGRGNGAGASRSGMGGARGGRQPVLPERSRPCASCGNPMNAAVATCPGCGVASTPWTQHGGHWWARDEEGEWRYLDDTRGAWISPTDGSLRAAAGVTPTGATTFTTSPLAGHSVFVGLDHVQVAAPTGKEFDARRFYGGLLGLPEIDKPDALATRGGCWFQAGAQALHVGVVDDFVPAKKAHPAFRIRTPRELQDIAERLDAAGYDVTWADESEIPGVRRFHVHDPFGNRLELLS